MTTRDEVLKLLKQAGFHPEGVFSSSDYAEQVAKLIDLAKQQERDRAIEECWKTIICHDPRVEHPHGEVVRKCIQAIRERGKS